VLIYPSPIDVFSFPLLTHASAFMGKIRMSAKLTSAFVNKAAPPADGAAELVYWDETQRGFGLAVTKGGRNSSVVGYRAGDRKRCMHLKPGLTLTDARRKATAVLGAVARGGDPLTERRMAEPAKSETLIAIAEESDVAVHVSSGAIWHLSADPSSRLQSHYGPAT
jgi:Arm DNA-binding domain